MSLKPIPFGKYFLLSRVNTGGMAEVFRAKAFGVEGFERIVAVKRILPSIAADTDFITMFIDEAKLAVQLNHANIAQIFDLGKVSDSYFIALEYVHGKDLRAVFDKVRAEKLRVPVELACYVMMKICEGLDYAHRKHDSSGRPLELVHRDVSPQNMLISFDGDVKLIDFGIAKAAGQASRTRTGILKGKFGYLSPEQVDSESVDQRSDIFGIGIVLYELLTGERLFAGDSDFSTIEKVRNLEIAPARKKNPQIPKALERAILKALSRDRTTRYQAALELHDDLQAVLLDRTRRGHPFGRKELSTWMLAQFPEDAARDPEEVGDLDGAESLAASFEDATPVAPPTESNAVYKETRDAPEEGKNKHPSTILGMPAVLPPADLAAPKPARSLPPPPPGGRGGRNTGPSTRPPALPGQGIGRTVPPPPPRVGAPAAPSWETPEAGLGAFPAPVAESSVPSSRSVPPPPPGASSTLPQSAHARGPSLSVDWDADEELSTQIYDRPADASDYLYESEESSGRYNELDSLRVSELAQHQAPSTRPPVPPRKSPSYAPNSYEAQSFAQSGKRPQTYPPAQASQQFGLATQSPQSYAVPNGYSDSQASYSNFPDANDGFGNEATPPPGVHVSPRAYTQSDPNLPRVEPMGSLRAPPSTDTMAMAAGFMTERRTNPLHAALAVAAVVMLCFIGYEFLARTEPGVVQLTAHPADSVLTFDGKPYGTTSPFVVTNVSPNDKHVIEVQKAGYRSWSQEVQVQPGQTLQFPVTLQPAEASDAPAVAGVAQGATGGFSIETTPSGAKVVLDGQELGGVTPLRVGNLLARGYDLRLQLSGFKEHQAKVDVKSGVDQSLPRVVLQPERVRVRITSEPSGGEAVITRGTERRVLGRTPVDVSLDNEGAPWNVEVSKTGYEPFGQPISIHEGSAEVSLRAVLSRRAGEEAPLLAASEPPRASRPSSADSESSAPAPAREKEKEPVSEGGQGTLRINSRPWSQVSIDGRSIGNTPQMNVALPSGTHKVTLLNPEFNLKKSLTITIKPGQTETQIIALQ